MDADTLHLILRILSEPQQWLTPAERTVVDNLLESAIVDETIMAELISALNSTHIFQAGLNWFRRSWCFYKVSRWGIRSLGQHEILALLSCPPQLVALREAIQSAFDEDGGNQYWWRIRLASATRLIDKLGLSKANREAVFRYENQLKQH